jgi:hypothetical protein
MWLSPMCPFQALRRPLGKDSPMSAPPTATLKPTPAGVHNSPSVHYSMVFRLSGKIRAVRFSIPELLSRSLNKSFPSSLVIPRKHALSSVEGGRGGFKTLLQLVRNDVGDINGSHTIKSVSARQETVFYVVLLSGCLCLHM